MPSHGRLRVLHLIPLIDQGGAEAMLARLMATTRGEIDHHVATMLAGPNFFGIDPALVSSPASGQRRVTLAMIRHLRETARAFAPHVIHSWMYHANLATLVLPRRGLGVVWSIHNMLLEQAISRRRTRVVDRLCASLSRRIPDRIVYVAAAARADHEAIGYASGKGLVIPTAVDLARFDQARFPPRRPGAGSSRPAVIAMVARYGLEKGHHFLIDAIAAHPAREQIELTFVGRDCDTAPELASHLARTGLAARSRVSGPVTDIERIYAEADILVLPSQSEAMPLTAIEARAMGVVVVASRVGGVPDLGIPEPLMFPPGDRPAFAASLMAALAACVVPRRPAADPVLDRFDIRTVGRQYAELYASVAKR